MEDNTATKNTETLAVAKPAEEKKAVATTMPAEKKDAVAKKTDAAPAKKAEASAKAAEAKGKAAESKAKAESKKPAAEKKDEKKREIVLERVCTVNLTDVYNKTKDKRLARAVKIVRAYAARHAKAPLEKVRLATSVNEQIRTHGSSWVQKKIKIRLTKDKEGSVLAELSK